MSNVKKISICAILVTASFLLSKLKFFEFLFPFGGSVTLFSMLFLALPAYFCGIKYGILSCLIFSSLHIINGSHIYSAPQAFFDYVLSYLFFFITGFSIVKKKKNGFLVAFIIAAFCRWIFSTISGLLFFMEYTPEGFHPLVYPFVYNAMYIIPEAIITIVVIQTDFFKKYILRHKFQ